MTFLFVVGMMAFLFYAEGISSALAGILCIGLSLFCAGGVSLTYLYDNLAGHGTFHFHGNGFDFHERFRAGGRHL